MVRVVRLGTAVTLVTLVAAGPAAAARPVTRYAVPGGNSASTTCTSVSANCSLENAIGRAVDGDIVLVRPGTHTATQTITWKTAIDVRGASGPRPQVNIGGTLQAQPSSGTGRLRHLAIAETGTPEAVRLNAPNAGVPHEIGDDLVISTHSTLAPAVDLDDGALLRNSIVTSDGQNGAALGGGNNPAQNPQRYDFVGVTAIATGPGSAALRVKGSCFQPGICTSSNLTVRNSILHGVASDVDARTNLNQTVTIAIGHSNYSHVQETGTPEVTDPGAPGSGNQMLPPGFVDAAGGDFHETCESPTIDAGVADPDGGTNDAGGSARVIGPNPDMGAFELPQPPPGADTTAATDVGPSSAQLNGTIDTHACGTAWHFEWGTTTAYGNRSPSTDGQLPGGADPVPVSVQLSGLATGTIYHYRLVASNRFGEMAGPDLIVAPGLGPDPFAGVRIHGGRARLRKGAVHIRVTCPADTPGACGGRLALNPRARTAARQRSLGHARFVVAAGKTKAVRVRLSRSARHAMRHRRRLKATASATARDARGTVKASAAAVTLLAAVQRRRS